VDHLAEEYLAEINMHRRNRVGTATFLAHLGAISLLMLFLVPISPIFAQGGPQVRVPTFGPSQSTGASGQASLSAVQATAATASSLVSAMDVPANLVVSASLGASDPQGAHVFGSALGGFPTRGSAFATLSTGTANNASLPNNATNLSTTLGGSNNSQGNDLVQLTLVLRVPTGSTAWSVDWKLLSEEFPEYVGSAYNDAFLIETQESTFTIAGSTVSAPNNTAFDSSGRLISVNTTGALSMTSIQSVGTTYDGSTATLSTCAPVAPGASQITAIFSIMDLGDSIFDTTVFLDNFRFQAGACSAPNTKTLGEKAAEFALSVVGGPYVLGNEGYDYTLKTYVDASKVSSGYRAFPGASTIGVGLDCSGLVLWAFNKTTGPPRI
jgi:cell wall-associated NlpC family hydrolase